MNISEAIKAGLEEAGVSKKRAGELTRKVITWGAENGLAGERVYWPARARPLSPTERDAAIRKEFRPGRLREVCEKYGVGRETVYKALRG